MRTLTVLTAGVSLVFGLQAADIPAAQNVATKTALERELAGRVDAAAGRSRAAISGALALVDRTLGDYEGAERVLRAAISDPLSGAQASDIKSSVTRAERASLLLSLTDLLREEARETEAFAALNEANQLTGLSPIMQTAFLVEAGELNRDMGLWSESIAAWNKVGEIADSEHSSWLESVFTGGIGDTWLEVGNLTRAEPLLRRSLQLIRDDSDAPATQMLTALATLARLYIAEDKLALGEEILDEAVAKGEASFGPGHPQVGLLLEMRSRILSGRGETQAAREDLERARTIMDSHFGPESIAVAGVLAELGDLEMSAHHIDSATTQYKAAMRIIEEAGGNGARLRKSVAQRYATALKAAHKSDEAKAVLAEGTAKSFREK